VIYLDNNATTTIDPAAVDAMLACYRQGAANPSSQHGAGRIAHRRWTDALESIALLLGDDIRPPGSARLIVTSGGSEANNFAMRMLAARSDGPICISAVEHPSVSEAAAPFAHQGRRVIALPVNPDGRIDLQRLSNHLTELHESHQSPAVVALMLANNETGVIQPVAEVAAICQRLGIPLHCDAVQAVGKIPFQFPALGATTVTIAAHKFHGPVGIGALWVRPGFEVQHSLIVGGQQQLGARGGTEPVPLLVGMAEALRQSLGELSASMIRVGQLRDQFENQLSQAIDGLVIHGHHAARLPGTSYLSFPAADRQTMLMALDLAGLACSAGSACASGSSQTSPVLEAMGVPPAQRDSALRFSFSRLSTSEDLSGAVDAILRCYRRLRTR
jgi:cysteine desulfurase